MGGCDKLTGLTRDLDDEVRHGHLDVQLDDVCYGVLSLVSLPPLLWLEKRRDSRIAYRRNHSSATSWQL